MTGSAFYSRGPAMTDTLRPSAGANLMGSDLYNNLIRYFVGHLTELRNVS